MQFFDDKPIGYQCAQTQNRKRRELETSKDNSNSRC